MKKIFISYSHKDEQFKDNLIVHLKPLIRQGKVDIWQDRMINVGSDWNESIINNLNNSDIIIFLLSPDFLASDYINDVEVEFAVNNHNNNKCILVPILIRPCDYSSTLFKNIQGLPTDMKAINSSNWEYDDEAWMNVINGLKKVIGIEVNSEKKSIFANKGYINNYISGDNNSINNIIK